MKAEGSAAVQLKASAAGRLVRTRRASEVNVYLGPGQKNSHSRTVLKAIDIWKGMRVKVTAEMQVSESPSHTANVSTNVGNLSKYNLLTSRAISVVLPFSSPAPIFPNMGVSTQGPHR
jgi:hypothetical protein